MKEKRIKILQELADGELTPEEADEQLLKIITDENVSIDFADKILMDFEMNTFDDPEQTLCWVLAGTEQKFTTKDLFYFYFND